MRTNHHIQLCLILLIIGFGGSACVSQCDINPHLCESRPIDLKLHKIDRSASPATGNTFSIHIPDELLDGTKVARFLAPLPAGSAQPGLSDMPLVPENDSGDFSISLDENITKLQPGCSYYLNVFLNRPSYQIVDDICKYPIMISSGKLEWQTKPVSWGLSPQPATVTGNHGVWIYDGNTIILQQPDKSNGASISRYLAISFGNSKLAKSDEQISSVDSFAYFKNGKGLLASYSDVNVMTPDVYLPGFANGKLVFNSTGVGLTDFGKFSDLTIDGGFTFLVALTINGELRAWNSPKTGQMAEPRRITLGAQNVFKKIVVIKQNNQPGNSLNDLIAFDAQGTPQVFLQQSDGSFAYNKALSEARQDLGSGAITAIAVGDVDGDAVDDLAMVRQGASDTVKFYLNRGDGSFQVSPTDLRLMTTSPAASIAALAIGPIGSTGSSALNNLVVLDSNANVLVYQNMPPKSCSLATVKCEASPATMNAR